MNTELKQALNTLNELNDDLNLTNRSTMRWLLAGKLGLSEDEITDEFIDAYFKMRKEGK